MVSECSSKNLISFVLRLPPQNKAHATFMRPLQCVLQHHVANLALSTHMVATPHDNNHAAIPMRSATTDSRNAKNYAHRNNRLTSKRSKRTRCAQEVPFIAGCSHFTRKNTRFRAPASSQKQSQCNIQAATAMRFAA